jgi:DNA replication protein DnaC
MRRRLSTFPQRRSCQFPVDNWYAVIGDPTLADAILDRLVHNAYKILLKGESMRKRKARLTTPATSE